MFVLRFRDILRYYNFKFGFPISLLIRSLSYIPSDKTDKQESMQGQENNIVKQQLIRQIKVFASKQQMIQYYMSYDFPEKQRAVKGWWQALIENVIRKKNQIYVTFKDLQNITNINGMKPVPLKNVLRQLKREFIFIREQDITQQRKPQKRVKPWYTSIISLAWANSSKDQLDYPFTFSAQQKIISTNLKQRKKRQLLSLLQKQFLHQNSRFMRNLLRQISWELKIDQVSVELLFKQLKRQKEVVIINDENFGDQVLIYTSDNKKIRDQNFIKIQKIKCSLKASIERFQIAYDKSSAKIDNLKQKAKQALKNNDKGKAKVIVTQAKKQQDYREKINVQKHVLEQKIHQIQVNEMNKSSIDLLQQAQSAYQQVAVNQERFDEVIQKARQIQMESQQGNRRFQELAASEEVADEVDDLMREIEEQVQKKKVVEPKGVNVIIPDRKEQLQIQKPERNLSFN